MTEEIYQTINRDIYPIIDDINALITPKRLSILVDESDNSSSIHLRLFLGADLLQMYYISFEYSTLILENIRSYLCGIRDFVFFEVSNAKK